MLWIKRAALFLWGYVFGFATMVVLVLAFGTYEETPASVPAPMAAIASTPTGTPTPIPSTPTTPLPTATRITRLGETYQQNGYSLTAIAVENPSARPGIFYEPQEGKKLVAVEFMVGNISVETFDSNVLYATLVDNNGLVYGAESVAVEESMEMLEIHPGESVRGWAGFTIPQDAHPVFLKYHYGFRDDELQVGLTPR